MLDLAMNYNEAKKIVLKEKYPNESIIKYLANMNVDNVKQSLPNINEEEWNRVQKQMTAIKTNEKKIIYQKKYEYGRYYSKGGLQGIGGWIRRLILNNTYVEVDFVNSLPTICQQLCETYNIDAPYLDDYINNREKHLLNIMEEYSVDKDVAKNLFLIITHGGTFKTWIVKNKLNITKDTTEFIENYYKGILNITKNAIVFPNYKNLLDFIYKQKNKAELSDFSALAIYMQDIESKCINVLCDYLKQKAIDVNTIIHDGLYIPKHLEMNIDLDEAQRIIYEKIGVILKLKKKFLDIEESDLYKINIIKENQKEYKTDEENMEYLARVLDIMEGMLYKTKDKGFMCYDEKRGIWEQITPRGEYDSGALFRALENNKTKIWFPDKTDLELNDLFENGWNFHKALMCLKPYLFNNLPNIDTIDSDADIGFLAFRNGVLNMRTLELLPHSPDYRFVEVIERNWDNTFDYEDLSKDIVHKIFGKMLTDDEKKQYFLQLLARGVAGCYKDRNFATLVGDTACGKGVLTQLITSSLEKAFSYTFNADNFYSKKDSSDPEIENMVMVKMHRKRIQISSEITMKTENGKARKLDGNIAKRWYSGGDELPCREKHGNTIQIKNKGFGLILVNDIPAWKSDNALLNRLNTIEADRCSSKDITEDNDTHFVADESIFDFIDRVEVKNAFIYLMCKYYNKSIDSLMPKPKSVQEANTIWAEVNMQGTNWFLNNENLKVIDTNVRNKLKVIFKNTEVEPTLNDYKELNIEDMYIECKKLLRLYNDDNVDNVSTNQKFNKILKTLGIYKIRKKVQGKVLWVYMGIQDLDCYVEYEE